jgi:signal transduction histidine kinase
MMPRPVETPGARGPARLRSPTPVLLVGLLVILGTVAAYSWYVSGQIDGLRRLQTELTDRNRRESLQLLRVQNDLNQLGLGMRDMLDTETRYPLSAWAAQFERIRRDLDDALTRQAAAAGTGQSSEQRDYLASAVQQFWDASDRIFALADAGQEAQARSQVQLSLQARQAALSSAVARLLVQNNEREEEAARQTQAIYDRVERQAYLFLAATLGAIVATGLLLVVSNRRLFGELSALSEARQDLARTLITTRESTLRELARELHDEFGQLLTAVGTMLGRVAKQTPADSSMRADLREIGEVAQTALDNVRGLSQALHPSILEELGLAAAVDWYVSTVERQLGVTVDYDRRGTAAAVDAAVGIQVYRVLQEALSNVARHSGTQRATVRLEITETGLALEVEDAGKGVEPQQAARGLGLTTMRERADLVGGQLRIERGAAGGTRVRLTVPLGDGNETRERE